MRLIERRIDKLGATPPAVLEETAVHELTGLGDAPVHTNGPSIRNVFTEDPTVAAIVEKEKTPIGDGNSNGLYFKSLWRQDE